MKIKLLFVNADMEIGGIERVLADILNCLDFNKYSVDLLLTRFKKMDYSIPNQVRILTRHAQIMDGPFISAILRCIKAQEWDMLFFRILIALKKYIGEKKVFQIISKKLFPIEDYDYIIAMRPDMVGKLVGHSTIGRHKDLWWHHGDLGLNDKQSLNRDFALFDRIITTSNTLKEYLVSCFPEFHKKIVVIPNGINIEYISKMSTAYNPYSIYPPSTFQIVSVGRINPEKRYHYVVDVTKKLLDFGISNFQWHVIGDGIEFKQIQDLIVELNLTSHVIMHGKQLNPYPYMRYANVFVHTSFVESVGLVILEAMSLKVPCIVTESRGPCEYMENKKNGLLVNGDVNSVADAVLSFISGMYDVNVLKENGYKTALLYDISNVKRNFESIFT